MKNSIRSRLQLAVFGLTIMPLFVAGLGLIISSYHSQKNHAVEHQGEIAAYAGKEIGNFFAQFELQLKTTIHIQNLLNLEYDELQTTLSKLEALQPAYTDLYLLDSQSQELGRVSQRALIGADDLQDRSTAEEFVSVIQTAETHYSVVKFDEVSGEPYMTISIPIIDSRSGDVEGVLGSVVNLKAIWDLVSAINLDETGLVYVIGPQGNVVAHRNLSVVLRGTYFGIPKTEGIQSGLEGGVVVLATYPISLGEEVFYVVAERPLSEALNLTIRTVLALSFLIIFAIGAAALLGAMILRQVVQPIEKLATTVQSISDGDFTRRVEITSNDEIGELGLSFNRMASELGEMLVSLEQKVEDRTKELKMAQMTALSMMEDAEDARQKAEEANKDLTVEKAFSDQMVNSIPGIFYVIDSTGHFIRWNKNFTTISEYSDEELADLHPTELFRGADKERVGSRIQDVFVNGVSDVEASFTSKSGVSTPFYFTGYRMIYEGNPILIGAGVDISERKRMEDQVKEALAFNETIISSSTLGLSAYNPSGQCIMANDAMAKIIGATRQQILQQNYHQIESWKESGLYDCAISARDSGNVTRTEIHIVSSFKKECWLECRIIPFTAQNTLHLLFIIDDISDRMQAQITLAEKAEELQRSNLELEQFAYVASHDLQEPLRMVASYLQLLEHRYSAQLSEDAKEFIGFAVDGATRMKRLINDLLAFSRISTRGSPLEISDLNKVMQDVTTNLQTAIEESRATLVCADLPTVLADEIQMNQLLQNLVGNAIKYRKLAEDPLVEISVEQENGFWKFVVRDNGIGFDPKFSERIFVIFQRLHGKNEYSGTGIGLSISKRIVERHGGRIWAESSPGLGSQFYFTLPIKQGDENHEK